jgi:hypothetical protein
MKPLYPPKVEWVAIRAEIMARAKNRCEWEGCRVPHHAYIQWVGEDWLEIKYSDLRADEILEDGKIVFIVLTLAHLDQDPRNNGEPGKRPNLMALCQRHHNRLDMPYRRVNSRNTRNKKKGTVDLFEIVNSPMDYGSVKQKA